MENNNAVLHQILSRLNIFKKEVSNLILGEQINCSRNVTSFVFIGESTVDDDDSRSRTLGVLNLRLNFKELINIIDAYLILCRFKIILWEIISYATLT